jgi:hypothetical protein
LLLDHGSLICIVTQAISQWQARSDPFGSLEKILTFFSNFLPKKPENKLEGISPNYNNPHKGYALPGAKRFLNRSLGFLFFILLSPGATAYRTAVHRKSDQSRVYLCAV